MVTYDEKSFILNGERVFLTSGSVHYFRAPRESWHEILLKAKRCGLNTIDTYVAWNMHEPEEGTYRFSGDLDLDYFISLAGELGLYVIMRPGPYICAEWDFGGFPAWLINKEGVRLRTYNKPYLEYVDRFFDKLVPIFAARQATRGGNVILVQVENEYQERYGSEGIRYMEYVRDGLRSRSIDVPLITCAGSVSGAIECVNSHNPAELMPWLKERQPDMPLFSTEFWSGWYDLWGSAHNGRSPEDLMRATFDIMAVGGAGYNYYMYFGGTNFGYTPMYLQTTSYDYDAAISEAAGCSDNYFAAKSAAYFAQSFADVLTNAPQPAGDPAQLAPGVRTLERASDRGRIVFVQNVNSKQVTVQLEPDDGAIPEITVPANHTVPFVFDYAFSDGSVLNWCTGTILTIQDDGSARAVIVVYGEANTSGQIGLTVAGKSHTLELAFPQGDSVGKSTVGNVVVLSMNKEMAARTYLCESNMGNHIVCGPHFVRNLARTDSSIVVEADFTPGKHTCYIFGPEAEMETEVEVARDRPELPALTGWLMRDEPLDIGGTDKNWQTTDKPVSMIALGNGSNAYGWYRTAFDSETEKTATLSFADCADRLTLFVNGGRVGTSQAPPEDRKGKWAATFNVHVQQGRNTVLVLADNLGLAKGDWQIGRPMETEKKGIWDDVTLGDDEKPLMGWQFLGRLKGEREGWYLPDSQANIRWLPLDETDDNAGPRWFKTEFQLPQRLLDTRLPLRVAMDRMGKGVIWINGHNLGRYWNVGPQYDYYVPHEWLEKHNLLVIVEEETHFPTNVRLVYDQAADAIPTRVSFA